MASGKQPVENKRRIPRQSRAAETVSAILEGAAQVLETGGTAGFTTNAVAERAGVSIGTLYQYFNDKAALLRAVGEREMAATVAAVAKALRGESDATPEGRLRAMIREIINAFHGRQRARKAVVQAVLAQGLTVESIVPVGALINEAGQDMSREQIFVVSRALMGAIRAAVLEEQPFLKSQAFEDELLRLVMSYRTALGK